MNEIPGTSEAPSPRGRSGQVLAYLELLQAQEAVITVETAAGVEVEGRIQRLDADKGRLVMSIPKAPPQGLQPDESVRLYFSLYHNRWIGHATVQFFTDGRSSFILNLPLHWEAADRRKRDRSMVDEAVPIQVVLRTTRPEDRVVTGLVQDISEGGFRMKVLRALDPRTQTNIPLSEELLETDMDVDSVHITGLPPQDLELGGRVIHLGWTPSGLALGVRFRNLKPAVRKLLEAFLVERPTLTIPELPFLERGTAPVSATPSLPPSADAARGMEAGGDNRRNALQRLKKRVRTVLVTMDSGPDRDALVDFLMKDGYGQVIVAASLHDVSEAFQGGAVHLAIIDGGVPEMHGVELASFMHFAKGDVFCPILLAEYDVGTNLRTLATKAGVEYLLPRPYLAEDFTTFLEVALELRSATELPPRFAVAQEPPPLPTRPAAPTQESPRSALSESRQIEAQAKLLKARRSLALVMAPGPERDALHAFLMREGFSRILFAGTVSELVKASLSPSLSLLFVDIREPGLNELEVATFLARHPFDRPVRILLASAHSGTYMSMDVRSLGIAQLVPRPYALDHALLETLLYHLEAED